MDRARLTTLAADLEYVFLIGLIDISLDALQTTVKN